MIEKKYKDSSTEPSEEIILNEEKVSEIFNNFFKSVPNIKIPIIHNCNIEFKKTDDSVLNAINNYKHHSSIVMIKGKIEPESMFSFPLVQYKDILIKTRNLNVLKASQQSNIPSEVLTENSEYISCYFHENINCCLQQSLLFLHDLKLADVVPV